MARRAARPALTADQTADAERLHATLLVAVAPDLQLIAETLAATTDATLFGATEFVLRDLVRGLAAKALDALADREKNALPAAAAAARPAPRPPSTSGCRAAPPSPYSARSA